MTNTKPSGDDLIAEAQREASALPPDFKYIRHHDTPKAESASICTLLLTLCDVLIASEAARDAAEKALIENAFTCSGNAGPRAIICFECDASAPSTRDFRHNGECPVGAAQERRRQRGEDPYAC